MKHEFRPLLNGEVYDECGSFLRPVSRTRRAFGDSFVPAGNRRSAMPQISGRIRGENGTVEHSAEDVGDPRVALFFRLVRGESFSGIQNLVASCLQYGTAHENITDMVVDLFVMAFHTRDCRGGKGEREIFLKFFFSLYARFPATARLLVPLIAEYGYFKDYFLLVESTAHFPWQQEQCQELCDAIIEYVAQRLLADEMLVDSAHSQSSVPVANEAPAAYAERSAASEGSPAGDTHLSDCGNWTADATRLAEIRRKVSLCAKYAPREGSPFAERGSVSRAAFKKLLQRLFPHCPQQAKMHYRKLISKLTRFLDVTEVKMCGKRYAEIEFSRVPSLCSKRYCKAFLNEHLKEPMPTCGSKYQETGNRYPNNPDRVQARQNLCRSIAAGKVQGKQLFPHEIVQALYGNTTGVLNSAWECPGGGSSASRMEREMLNVQWNDIRQNLLNQLAADAATIITAADVTDANSDIQQQRGINVGKLVPLSDVSGSMSGNPMLVSIALGILISEVNHPAFRDRVVTFESNPQWVSLSDCSNIAQKVEKLARAPWGGSTNIEGAMDLLEQVVRKHRLPVEEVPDLIIFSDMQFDCATDGGYNSMTQLERIRVRFHQLGMDLCGEPYPAPRIIFWNLRAGTVGFPAQADSENVQLLSGFSPALLKCVLEGGAMETEEEVEETVMDAAGNVTTRTVTQRVKATPYSTLRRVLDNARYDPVRRLLAQSNEGSLDCYRFPANPADCSNPSFPSAPFDEEKQEQEQQRQEQHEGSSGGEMSVVVVVAEVGDVECDGFVCIEEGQEQG